MALRQEHLSTSLAALEALWGRYDKTRSTSATVTVPKDALAAILLDHGRMARELFPSIRLPRNR